MQRISKINIRIFCKKHFAVSGIRFIFAVLINNQKFNKMLHYNLVGEDRHYTCDAGHTYFIVSDEYAQQWAESTYTNAYEAYIAHHESDHND